MDGMSGILKDGDLGYCQPVRPPRRAPWNKTDSIALIACRGGHGCILDHDGLGIEADVEALGHGSLTDHGLDDAPDGLSIWEGRLHTSESHTPDGHEYDSELIGEFRSLTDDEWKLLQTTGTPWLLQGVKSI